jgi:hypothetical protein
VTLARPTSRHPCGLPRSISPVDDTPWRPLPGSASHCIMHAILPPSTSTSTPSTPSTLSALHATVWHCAAVIPLNRLLARAATRRDYIYMSLRVGARTRHTRHVRLCGYVCNAGKPCRGRVHSLTRPVVDRVFSHALNTVNKIRTGSQKPPSATRLRLYGLYKQAMGTPDTGRLRGRMG